MKISKKIIALVLVLSLVLILGACTPAGTDEPDPETTSSDVRAVKTQVAVQKGSLGIGIAKLKADRAYAYDVSYLETGEEVDFERTDDEIIIKNSVKSDNPLCFKIEID